MMTKSKGGNWEFGQESSKFKFADRRNAFAAVFLNAGLTTLKYCCTHR